MRLRALIVVLAVAAPAGLHAGVSSAQPFQGQSFLFGRPNGPQGPWCSHEDIGGGTVQEDCSFASFRDCRRAIGTLSTSFCTQSFVGSVEPVRRKKGRRHYRH